jgi:OmpA-OmpF porin, OOP family
MNARVSGLMAAVLAVAMVATTLPATAQGADASGATAEELLQLFQRQKSRGLKLAPNTGVTQTVDPVAEASATGTTPEAEAGATIATAEQPATSVEQVAANAVTTADDGATPVPVVYEEIDKADQVNIRVAFDFDSAVLRDSEKPKLTELCKAITQIDGVFRIVGHTDASGSDAYNEKLSLLRAEEVKRYLVSDCGLPAERLQAVGVGKRFLFNNDDPRSEENRRVEFQALS